ncbi:DNA-binding regulatory protein, YebC/PmpR family [Carboxydocella sporoproducens DSM 16521]|uniref:Probable transcriptional regulatory protein SAMN02745885_02442 n=2 Tax=Carboxydocella TaxID=178898 RepID=A0A1T4S4T4_9FIRM|nr:MULTISPECIES: YebC/PmpR family DNA-binding transcriptional regulator [Carboxydocella]AVX21519.1 DNA-binding regulatory protein, YebC/PmpR family [Carboxydocella thermautotrophica]AVX31999.1 DNA-binding regulatory protein, YebC/PmpR family [Carboxydocella thermautotrophica]SKA23310.1 DNA-binding regulatory protein, YebC/PmpR family [Carboxydocella sporoproducens DSM 16521]
MAGHSKWANIKHRKAKQDAVRAKIFTKISREIMVAVKAGGPDPEANPRLKAVIQKARENNIPNDNIQRVIERASGAGNNTNYEELVYEGYGPGGVAVLMNIMTDNRNRTASEIRHIFSRNGGSLGETGCVAWLFDPRGLIVIDKAELKADEDEVMLTAIEAGAEDVKSDEESMEIITQPDDFDQVKEALEAAGYPIAMAQVTMLPKTTVALTGDEAAKMLKLMEALEDHDDVQDVYANFDIDLAEMA